MQCARGLLSSAACPALHSSSILSHKRHSFRKNVIQRKMCVLIFSTTSAWNISHLLRFVMLLTLYGAVLLATWCHMTSYHNIHAPLHGIFHPTFIILRANQALIPSIEVLPSGDAMLLSGLYSTLSSASAHNSKKKRWRYSKVSSTSHRSYREHVSNVTMTNVISYYRLLSIVVNRSVKSHVRYYTLYTKIIWVPHKSYKIRNKTLATALGLILVSIWQQELRLCGLQYSVMI